MKFFVWLICGSLAAYCFYYLEEIKLATNETLNLGTLKGIENCVSYSGNELVSLETTRNVCSTRIQVLSFDRNLASGRAGPRIRENRVFLEGELQNKSSDHITTWVSLYIGIHDKDGVRQEFKSETQTWIEPSSSAKFDVEFEMIEPKQIEPIEFCADDDDAPKSCVYWGVQEIRAVKI